MMESDPVRCSSDGKECPQGQIPRAILNAHGLCIASDKILDTSGIYVSSESGITFYSISEPKLSRDRDRLHDIETVQPFSIIVDTRSATNGPLGPNTHGVAYRTLLPAVSFSCEGLDIVWTTEDGRPVIAFRGQGEDRQLLVGLNVEEEIVRYRQGDPARVREAKASDKACLGFGFERPIFLYENQIDSAGSTIPYADHLGFVVAECLAELSGMPLVEVLPHGACGAVILTGDDDQAHLEKYGEQLRRIRGLPITYFLHPLTRHTQSTLTDMPDRVEFGLHPDALERPDEYDEICKRQLGETQKLTDRPIRTVRNHGFLSDGYQGHLSTWEATGLDLDVNLPGVDGRALNGSFLPMPFRRHDGSWSEHYSLLTAFGDGMVQAQGLSNRQAARRIIQLARQIESDVAGVLVFNLHPQNTSDTIPIHRAVKKVARRKGWIALGLDSYLDWIRMLSNLRISNSEDGWIIRSDSPGPVQGLVLRTEHRGKRMKRELPDWQDEIRIEKE